MENASFVPRLEHVYRALESSNLIIDSIGQNTCAERHCDSIMMRNVGEDASAHGSTESDIHASQDYGESDFTQRRHRPRRSAMERRAQQQRSDARAMCKMLKGLLSLDQHRGCQLSHVGHILRDALQHTSSTSGVNHNANGYGNRYRPSLCRHFAVGRCTYGSRCKFRHEVGANPYFAGDRLDSTFPSHGYDTGGDPDAFSDEVNGNDRPYYHVAFDGTADDLVDSRVGHDSDGLVGDNATYTEIPICGHDHEQDCDLTIASVCATSHGIDAISSGRAHIANNYPATQHDADDDVEDIIGILRLLEGDDLQQALATLPAHLLIEVQSRLSEFFDGSSAHGLLHDGRSYTERDAHDHLHHTSMTPTFTNNGQGEGGTQTLASPPRGNDAALLQEQELRNLQKQDQALDDLLRHQASQLLRIHNGNKKFAKKLIGPVAVRAALKALGRVACSAHDGDNLASITAPSSAGRPANADNTKAPCRFLQRARIARAKRDNTNPMT